MEINLKRCPFCGGDAEFDSSATSIHVACVECKATSASFIATVNYCARDRAAEAWNCRVSELKAKPLTLEELRERDGREVYYCWNTKHEGIAWDIENPHLAKVNLRDESVSNKTTKHYFDQYGTRFIAFDRPPKEEA